MYDIRSAMLNIGIVFTPGKFKINLEKTWKTPGILVNLRSTDPELCTTDHQSCQEPETLSVGHFCQKKLLDLCEMS